MRIREKDELAIMNVSEKCQKIEIYELRDLLINKTADIIYFVCEDKLFGMVCLGDFLNKCKNGVVQINQEYTVLAEFDDEKARDIFSKRKNIQKIPIVDENGQLVADYSRWGEEYNGYLEWTRENDSVWRNLKKKVKTSYEKVYTINPIESKGFFFDWIEEKFTKYHVEYQMLNKQELKDLQNGKYMMIFADEDELRGTRCLEGEDYLEINDEWQWFTMEDLYDELRGFDIESRIGRYSASSEQGETNKLLTDLQQQGVKVFSVYNDVYYLSDYIKSTVRTIENNKKKSGQNWGAPWEPQTEVGKKFYDELLINEDYASGVAQNLIYDEQLIHAKNINLKGFEIRSKYYNVVDGHRKTCYEPNDYINKIYFFGQCLFMGFYNEDKNTIQSQLQKRLVEAGYHYLVDNCGASKNVFDMMQKQKYREGDIIVLYTGAGNISGVEGIDIRRVLEKNNVPAEWFIDSFPHCNHKVMGLLAEELFQMISSVEERKEAGGELIEVVIDDYRELLGTYIKNVFLERHFEIEMKQKDCERACLLVDLNVPPQKYVNVIHKMQKTEQSIIVFIPEEVCDKRYHYKEWIAEIRKSDIDEDKIHIVPSEKYVPYFNMCNSYYQHADVVPRQVEIDAMIFVQCIAEPLNIKKRYGVKPVENDIKEQQYSGILRKELLKYGMEYIEVV